MDMKSNPDHYKFGDVEVIDIVQHLDFHNCPTHPREAIDIFANVFPGFSVRNRARQANLDSASRISLDFRQYRADTSPNTPVVPLPGQAACHLGDVHQGRVSFLRRRNVLRADIAVLIEPAHYSRPASDVPTARASRAEIKHP